MRSWAACAASPSRSSKRPSPGCRSRPMPRSCSRVSSSPITSVSKARSANGPAITPATCGPNPCSTSRLSTIATIRFCSAACRIVRPALLRENIEKAGVPGVTAAWAHEVGNARLLLAVAVNQRYPGHAKQAGHIAAQCHVGAYCGRYVIVVDDDIDVSNLEEVIWALITRSDPATSIDIVRGAWSTPLDPRIE